MRLLNGLLFNKDTILTLSGRDNHPLPKVCYEPNVELEAKMERVNDFGQDTNLFDSHDGLGDISAGIIILGFGIGLLTGMVWLSGIWIPLLVPVWQEAKKRLARRRGGVAAIPAQVARDKAQLAMLAAVGTLTLLLGLVFFMIFSRESFLPGLRIWLQVYFELALGGLAALLFAIFGAINRTGRFFLYAFLAMAILTAGYLYQISLGISMTLLGGSVFLAGLIVLIRFLQENPAQ